MPRCPQDPPPGPIHRYLHLQLLSDLVKASSESSSKKVTVSLSATLNIQTVYDVQFQLGNSDKLYNKWNLPEDLYCFTEMANIHG